MNRPAETNDWPRSGSRKGLILLALLLGACATDPTVHQANVETRDASGFTIRDDVQADSAVRSDFDRALVLLEQEQYQQAIDVLERVVQKAPQATAAHIDLGIAYGRIDDLEKAEASIRKALEINPHHPVAHNELGMVYRRTGRFQAARHSYESALAEHPEFHYARLNLAILCDVYLADLGCALENYELYSRAVPDDEEAAIWIADVRNRAGR